MSRTGEIVLIKLAVFILIAVTWNVPVIGWLALILLVTNVAGIAFAMVALARGGSY